jgi:hypothetical protein
VQLKGPTGKYSVKAGAVIEKNIGQKERLMAGLVPTDLRSTWIHDTIKHSCLALGVDAYFARQLGRMKLPVLWSPRSCSTHLWLMQSRLPIPEASAHQQAEQGSDDGAATPSRATGDRANGKGVDR